MAYHGFASGDLEEDAWPVRYFDSRGFEMLCAQCYSKSRCLYGNNINLSSPSPHPRYLYFFFKIQKVNE